MFPNKNVVSVSGECTFFKMRGQLPPPLTTYDPNYDIWSLIDSRQAPPLALFGDYTTSKSLLKQILPPKMADNILRGSLFQKKTSSNLGHKDFKMAMLNPQKIT